MKILKITGILVMAMGGVDLLGNLVGFDLWGGFLGINLPEIIWKYSAYIEIIAGYFIFSVGSPSSSEDEHGAEEKETSSE